MFEQHARGSAAAGVSADEDFDPLFIAAFGQANVGDTSPNTLGAFCQDTGAPADVSERGMANLAGDSGRMSGHFFWSCFSLALLPPRRCSHQQKLGAVFFAKE